MRNPRKIGQSTPIRPKDGNDIMILIRVCQTHIVWFTITGGIGLCPLPPVIHITPFSSASHAFTPKHYQTLIIKTKVEKRSLFYLNLYIRLLIY